MKVLVTCVLVTCVLMFGVVCGSPTKNSHHQQRENESIRDRLHRPVTGPETRYNKLDNSTNSICLECEIALTFLQGEINIGLGYEFLVQEAILICIDISNYTTVFCEGYVPLLMPIIYHQMSTQDVDPVDACGEVLTAMGCTTSNPSREWTISIQGEKPPVISLLPPTDGAGPTLKVLQLADTHMDPEYVVGSLAACPEELCCRAESGEVTSPEDGAWEWGDYRHCGTPPWMLTELLTQARDTHPDIDYIIWTGDLVPHNMWSTSQQFNLAVIRETINKVREIFPDVPIFPVVGNHEANPLDQFPDPDDDLSADLSADWLYAELSQQWSSLVPELDNSTVRRAAYYSVNIKPGFRLISFNSMFGYANNYWLVENSQDPGGELAWLENELNKAEANGELVHILGHVPLGILESERTWSREYNRLVLRYENTIRGQFFGHTHYDEFNIFHDEANRPINVGYICPSVTPWYDFNPAYRIYHIDGDREDSTRLVLDHETYYANLTEAQETQSFNMQKLYSAKELYEMPSLTPQDWQDLVEKMAGDRSVFDLYYRNYASAADPYVEAGCDDQCYQQKLCDIVTTTRNELDSCFALLKKMKK